MESRHFANAPPKHSMEDIANDFKDAGFPVRWINTYMTEAHKMMQEQETQLDIDAMKNQLQIEDAPSTARDGETQQDVDDIGASHGGEFQPTDNTVAPDGIHGGFHIDTMECGEQSDSAPPTPQPGTLGRNMLTTTRTKDIASVAGNEVDDVCTSLEEDQIGSIESGATRIVEGGGQSEELCAEEEQDRVAREAKDKRLADVAAQEETNGMQLEEEATERRLEREQEERERLAPAAEETGSAEAAAREPPQSHSEFRPLPASGSRKRLVNDNDAGDVSTEVQEKRPRRDMSAGSPSSHHSTGGMKTTNLPHKDNDIAFRARPVSKTGKIQSEQAGPERALGFACKLLPHQVAALSWLAKSEDQYGRCVLADEMGLGKTISTLALILAQPTQHVAAGQRWWLLLSQSRAMAEEIESKTMPYRRPRVCLYHGDIKPSPEELCKFDIVITSFGLLEAEFWRLPHDEDDESDQRKPPTSSAEKDLRFYHHNHEWHRVVLDEAHVIRNPKTKVSRAVAALQSNRRLCLTGGEITKAPQHNCLSYPSTTRTGRITSKPHFSITYGQKHQPTITR